ncbi:MAG: cysteine desulfurase [Candidatus Methanomethylophilaceae archaeon]|jgi:cysteine desulfurase/selenocysteine lyase
MNVSDVRNDFPTMRKGKGVYLDSACQSLRPDRVIDAVMEYYTECPSCGGRSVHSMSTAVSVRTDETREALAGFFGTDDPDCYIFTKNCTEGINTVAYGLDIKKGDVVVTTDTEHNSNHVPWLVLADERGVKRRFSVSKEDGEFDMDSFLEQMCRDVRLVSVQHCSNVTGCVTPVREIAEIAHDCGALVLVDGSQAAPHFKVDLEKLDVDFYSASIHKMLGPSGMGFLYGKKDLLKQLRPLVYGGGAVGRTTYSDVQLAPVPDKFEAGLQNYAGIFGTKAALEYISDIGFDDIVKHERSLMKKIFEGLEDVKGLSIAGPDRPERRCGIFAFNINGLLSHDIAMMLDNMDGIMIRSGMHCSHPLYESRGLVGSARASTYIYNNDEDISRFVTAVRKIAEEFGDH